MDLDQIEEHRKAIDEIDIELLRLLNARASHALKIGQVKAAHNQPIYVPEREKLVLQRLQSVNPGPLAGEAVERIFKTVILETRTLEDTHTP